jgi:DNA modification methylase
MAELIWDGKYDEHGKKRAPVRIELPFQTVETVNESVQERQRALDLFASGRDSEWRNRLIWGDKKYVLPSLLPEFAGKVDLIYIDPPFDTGADFSFTATLPSEPAGDADEIETFVKEPSILEQKAYRDTWGSGLNSYLQWFYECALQLRELLSEQGSIYVHLDWHVVHYAKAVLDEVFGVQCFVNEIVWRRKGGSALGAMRRLSTATDSLLLYSKAETYRWRVCYEMPSDEYIEQNFNKVDGNGRRFQATVMRSPSPRPNLMYDYKGYKMPPHGWSVPRKTMEELDAKGMLYFPEEKSKQIYKKIYLDEYVGQPINSLWDDIATLKGKNVEIVNYPTQKPEALLARVLKVSSDEGHLVLDCFCGSGTTAAVAEKLNRRWIACDLGRFAIHTTRKRLLEIPGVKPFVVQNLGKYERQAWQAAEFPANGTNKLEEQQRRDAAYRKFILELYRATPVAGHTWLHGVRGGRMVHVAAVDAPVTRSDVLAIAREVWKAAGKGPDAPTRPAVDILGWEFALDLNETAKEVAAQARVDANFKKIPREVLEKKAVEQGDIHFFELGALSVDKKLKKRELTLTVSDFVIPLDDVPAEVRGAIKHWSQMVDYWAVDWDFKDDTFHNQWQRYRTRKNPKLELSADHEYAEAGSYVVVVKVIDILGNDTTKRLAVEVK